MSHTTQVTICHKVVIHGKQHKALWCDRCVANVWLEISLEYTTSPDRMPDGSSMVYLEGWDAPYIIINYCVTYILLHGNVNKEISLLYSLSLDVHVSLAGCVLEETLRPGLANARERVCCWCRALDFRPRARCPAPRARALDGGPVALDAGPRTSSWAARAWCRAAWCRAARAWCWAVRLMSGRARLMLGFSRLMLGRARLMPVCTRLIQGRMRWMPGCVSLMPCRVGWRPAAPAWGRAIRVHALSPCSCSERGEAIFGARTRVHRRVLHHPRRCQCRTEQHAARWLMAAQLLLWPTLCPSCALRCCCNDFLNPQWCYSQCYCAWHRPEALLEMTGGMQSWSETEQGCSSACQSAGLGEHESL